MSDPFIGEIRYFPYARGAPSGWVTCDGSLLSIANYDTLFNLIGTTYGGDGQSTFGVPDLRGRVPVGAGSGYTLGQMSGQEAVTLNSAQLPSHGHNIVASNDAASTTNPTNQVFAAGQNLYFAPATPNPQAMATNATGVAGQNQPHENCAPTLTIRPCIAWQGIYPSQT